MVKGRGGGGGSSVCVTVYASSARVRCYMRALSAVGHA